MSSFGGVMLASKACVSALFFKVSGARRTNRHVACPSDLASDLTSPGSMFADRAARNTP